MSAAAPIHVRHVVRQFHPAIGGLEDSVANLSAALMAMPGFDSSVVTLDRVFGDPATRLAPQGSFRGVPIARIPFRGSHRYPLAPTVLRALDGADIVHVHGIDFFFDYLAATRALHRKPLVASTHGGFFHTDFASRAKQVWFNTVTRASARGYQRIFGSSEQDAKRFATIAPGRTMTTENGVDLAKWSDAASQSPVPTMIVIGRFAVNKGLQSLIQATASLDPAWHLIIAGQDSDLTAADLTAEAARRPGGARVTVVASPTDADIHALIGEASFLVSASRYEGFGLTAIEGLSAGLTPILNAIPPFERLVLRTDRGRIVDMAAPGHLASVLDEALHRLRQDPTGERTQNMDAGKVFGWGDVALRFANEYRAVIASAH